MSRKAEPTDIQRKTLEIMQRAIAPQTKLRKTRIAFPDARTVEISVHPQYSHHEEDRILDSLEALLDEAGIETEDYTIGRTMGGSRIDSIVEVVLAR